MHIQPYNNANTPIIDAHHPKVPLVYFNIVKLTKGESFEYSVADYETCVVPAHGTIHVEVNGTKFSDIGERDGIFLGDPSGVYAPVGATVSMECVSEDAEVFVAGAQHDEVYEAFDVRPHQLDHVQYGSDETKTHRKIKHILGQKPPGKVGRLLLSELYTVGGGGWSGFPSHKHDTDRKPDETHHDEVYNFRFNPEIGFGAQFLRPDEKEFGEVFHVKNGSTFAIDKGYHPCVAAPGYEMYYFTILGGKSQRPLTQYFDPEHAYQIETIPGIKDMIAKFK
ncbi:MAG: 5-deoxy-glucuronate isomerase [Pseudomonadota bacterium]